MNWSDLLSKALSRPQGLRQPCVSVPSPPGPPLCPGPFHHVTRALNPCPSKAMAGLGSVSSQPWPAMVLPSQAYPQSCVQVWPWPIHKRCPVLMLPCCPQLGLWKGLCCQALCCHPHGEPPWHAAPGSWQPSAHPDKHKCIQQQWINMMKISIWPSYW